MTYLKELCCGQQGPIHRSTQLCRETPHNAMSSLGDSYSDMKSKASAPKENEKPVGQHGKAREMDAIIREIMCGCWNTIIREIMCRCWNTISLSTAPVCRAGVACSTT